MFSTVNLAHLTKGLEALGKKYKLLNADVTCFDILHAKTGALILEACHEKTLLVDVACSLIELWFPGLYEAQLKSGRDWKHFWALDLKVEIILSEAGYWREDDDVEEEIHFTVKTLTGKTVDLCYTD